VFVELLPNATLATQAASEQSSRNLTKTVIAQEGGTLKSTFAIPGVPKSTAAYSLVPKGTASSATLTPSNSDPDYTGVVQVGRAAFRFDVTGPTATKAGFVGIAKREAALLAK